jgi:hypothetical protein
LKTHSRAIGRAIFASIFLAHLASSSVASAASADDLRALLQAGRPAEAYAAGRQSPELFGTPNFDFLFGVAAIDSGHAGEGVLALERFTLAFPDVPAGRLELARGYFVLGEDARSREEFEEALKRNPPDDARATIQRYLDAIRLRESRYTTTTGVWVEAGIGHDSNVNAGVSGASVNLPFFGQVLVNPAGLKRSSPYATWAAGAYVSHPVAPGVALFANGQIDAKIHTISAAKPFDQHNIAGNAGVSWVREKDVFRGYLQTGQVLIENDRFRSNNGAAAEWTRQLDELQSMTLGGQFSRASYAGFNNVRDNDFYGVSAGYRRAVIHALQPVFGVTVNAGREFVRAPQRDDLARRLLGMRVTASIAPAPKWGITAGLTWQRAEHVDADPLLGVKRRDDYGGLDLSVTYLWSRALSVRGEILLAKQSSNIELYQFDRASAALKLRYEFK